MLLDGGMPHQEDVVLLREYIHNSTQYHDIYQPLDLGGQQHTPAMEVCVFNYVLCVFMCQEMFQEPCLCLLMCFCFLQLN